MDIYIKWYLYIYIYIYIYLSIYLNWPFRSKKPTATPCPLWGAEAAPLFAELSGRLLRPIDRPFGGSKRHGENHGKTMGKWWFIWENCDLIGKSTILTGPCSIAILTWPEGSWMVSNGKCQSNSWRMNRGTPILGNLQGYLLRCVFFPPKLSGQNVI